LLLGFLFHLSAPTRHFLCALMRLKPPLSVFILV
jgi:hypothetical protein